MESDDKSPKSINPFNFYYNDWIKENDYLLSSHSMIEIYQRANLDWNILNQTEKDKYYNISGKKRSNSSIKKKKISAKMENETQKTRKRQRYQMEDSDTYDAEVDYEQTIRKKGTRRERSPYRKKFK